jgi:hypothetical protein
MSKNKLYLFILIACTSGYIYLLYNLYYSKSNQFSVCMIKNVSGFPCPSCGTTRAVQLLFKGDYIASVLTNPFGIIVSGSMLFLPFWIVFDFIMKKQSFYTFYNKMESILKQKNSAIPLIILVVLNWIWNINKGL